MLGREHMVKKPASTGAEKEKSAFYRDCMENCRVFNSSIPYCVIDKNYNLMRTPAASAMPLPD